MTEYKFMIVFATLGFDEKFIIRDIFSRGIKQDTKLVIFTSSEDQRVDKAYSSIVTTFRSLPLNIEKYKINIENPFYAISSIRKIILEKIRGHSEIVFNLSGGQRILLAYILSVITSEKINCEILMISEDSSIHVSLPSKIFFPLQLDSISIEIMRTLKEKGPLKPGEIVKTLNRGRTTIWRKINRLMEENLVEFDSRIKRYKITEIGSAFTYF